VYLAVPISPVGEKRMAFRSLDWSAFQQVRQLLTECTRARFTYDNGTLETALTDEVAAEIEFRQWVRTELGWTNRDLLRRTSFHPLAAKQ
jgi:hypothetical protein